MPKIAKPWVSWEELEEIVGGTWSPAAHTHEKADITDTPWAWADVLKVGSNLTDLATRQHAGLSDAPADAHHAQAHAASHHVAGADLLAFASITGFGTYIDQALLQASSPTFVTAKLTDLTDGYVPYHVDDATGLANSPIRISGTNVGIGGVPNHKLDVRGIGGFYASGVDGALADAIFIGAPAYPTTYRNKIQSSISSVPADSKLIFSLSTGAATYADVLTLLGNGRVIVNELTARQLLGTGADKELKDLTTITGLTTGHVLKATGAQSVAFQANNLGGLSDITLGTPTEASLLCYYQAGGFWYAGRPEYDIRYKSYDIEWEFWTATPPSPWAYGAISGGSASGVAATSHHPGSIAAYSGTAADSGYYWIAANNNLILSGVEQADFVFKTAASWDDRMGRFGFQDSITIAAATDGAYLNLNGRNIVGVTRKAGAQSTTGTSYNTSGNTWYRGRIIVNADATLITFLLYDAAGNELWTDSLNTNIPTAATGFGALGYYTVAADGTHIFTMDYAYLVCARGLVR